VEAPERPDRHYLDPIRAKSKLDLVIERICKAVAERELRPGDQLPGERQVAEALGVSRAVVREAFSALQVAGLVERRMGSGSFIAETANPSVLETRAHAVLDSSPDPNLIWSAREALEPSLWGPILEGVDDDSITALEENLKALEEAARARDWDQLFDADRRFHLGLVCATKNPYLIQVISPLLCQMNNPLQRAMKETTFLTSPASIEATVQIHGKILAALQARDETSFRKAMAEHYQMILSYLEEVTEETPKPNSVSSGLIS